MPATTGEKSTQLGSLFFVVVTLFWFAQYAYIPFLSAHLAALGMAASVIGVIVGAYGFTQLVCRIPLSIADNLTGNHRLFMAGGLVAIVVACLLPYLSASAPVYLLSRAIAGIASSSWVSFTAAALEGAGKAATQRMGKVILANNLGMLLAQVFGTLLYQFFGIMPLFLVCILAAAAGLVLLLRIPADAFKRAQHTAPPPGGSPLRTSLKSFAAAVRSRHLWLCALLMALTQFVVTSTNGSFTGVFAQALGAKGLQLGLISIVFLVMGLVVSFLLGKSRTATLPQRAILVASYAGLALYCWLTALCQTPGPLVAVQLLGGGCRTAQNVILMASAGRELADSQKAFAMGIFQSVYSLGMTFGPMLSGAVFDLNGSFSLTFFVVGLAGIVAAIWALLAYKNPAHA